jgi:hypothetical protein
MNCKICDRQFQTISSLNRHQRASKCSNAVQCKNCNLFYVSIAKHYADCVAALKDEINQLKLNDSVAILQNEIKQLKLENERYISRITFLQEKIENLDELNKTVKELTKTVEENNQKQVIHIHNHNNIKIDNLQIVNTNDFDTFSEFLTIDHIKKGAYGYAEYAINYPLHNKIVCTDFSRRKLKYKTDNGKVKNDINLISLSKDLFKSIHIRNKELIFDYAREYIETLKDPEEKMNAYCKFMNYISLIKDGSQGIHHELYTDFVKQICTMSHNT